MLCTRSKIFRCAKTLDLPPLGPFNHSLEAGLYIILNARKRVHESPMKLSIMNCLVQDGDPGSDRLFRPAIYGVAFRCWML
jgi:hypothetical protein